MYDILGSALPALKGAGSAVLRSALPYLLDPWTRRKTLQFIKQELEIHCNTTDQANYLFRLVEDESILKNIAAMKDCKGIYDLVESKIRPVSSTDPQQIEAVILTRALLVSLIKATSNNTYDSIIGSLILEIYLRENLVEISNMIKDYNYRKSNPIKAVQKDVDSLLRSAGQDQMGLEFKSDGSIEATGNPYIDMQITGESINLFNRWQKGELGPVLRLSSSSGEVRLTYGSDELDRILLPDPATSPAEYELHEPQRTQDVRLRIDLSDSPSVYCRAEFTHGLFSKGAEIVFGKDECVVKFTISTTRERTLKVNVSLKIDIEKGVLPNSYRDVLRAMQALSRSDMKLVIPQGTLMERLGNDPVEILRDIVMFSGEIWNDSQLLDVDSESSNTIAGYMSIMSEIHLNFQKIASFLEENHGIDIDQIIMPEEYTRDSLYQINRIARAVQGKDDRDAIDMVFDIIEEDYTSISNGLLSGGTVDFSLNSKAILDLGIIVLQLKNVLTVSEFSEIGRSDDIVQVRVIGNLDTPQLLIHPAGSYTALMQQVSRE